jgi:hypothetical protein
MNTTVPDSLIAQALDVREKRAELTKRYQVLGELNAELRAVGGVTFSEPNAEGWCVSWRCNPNMQPPGRGMCAAADRDRTSKDPNGHQLKWDHPELARRIAEAHAAWQAAANAQNEAAQGYEIAGAGFLEAILEGA